jgi:hypothetical protein
MSKALERLRKKEAVARLVDRILWAWKREGISEEEQWRRVRAFRRNISELSKKLERSRKLESEADCKPVDP